MSIPYNLSNPNFCFLEGFQTRKCQKESYTCPHAGCKANWDKEKNHFICPCHGSKFDKDGNVVKGPATQNLNCNE